MYIDVGERIAESKRIHYTFFTIYMKNKLIYFKMCPGRWSIYIYRNVDGSLCPILLDLRWLDILLQLRSTKQYTCSYIILTLDLEVCTFLVGKPWYCTNYRAIYYTNCFPVESLEYTCKMVHGYLSYSVKRCCVLTERVLYTHWKGVVVIFLTFQSRFAIIIVVFCAMLNNKLQLIPLTQIYLFILTQWYQ